MLLTQIKTRAPKHKHAFPTVVVCKVTFKFGNFSKKQFGFGNSHKDFAEFVISWVTHFVSFWKVFGEKIYNKTISDVRNPLGQL